MRDRAWIKMYRNDAWIEQEKKCKYCHGKLTKIDCTADHKKPKSKGGKDEKENIVAACKLCNETKKDLSVAVFTKKIKNPSGLDWDFWKIYISRKINLQTERSINNIMKYAK